MYICIGEGMCTTFTECIDVLVRVYVYRLKESVAFIKLILNPKPYICISEGMCVYRLKESVAFIKLN